MEPKGNSRRGPGVLTVVLVSALTSGVVAAGTVVGLLRYGGPLLEPEPQHEVGSAAPAVVPDLIGLRLEAADELLIGRELRLVVQSRRESAQPADTVIEQQPLGHSRVQAGAAVSVVVSEGADAIAVPELVGKSLPEARAALEAVGLTPGPVSEGAAGEADKVIASVPEAGAELQRGKPVALTIGPAKTVAVPQLIGLHRGAAKEAIEKAGLELGKVSEIYNERRRGDIVLEQSPDAKTRLEPGSEVDLIVNQGD